MTEEQLSLCRAFRVHCVDAPDGAKLGIARSVGSGELPLNGLRHPAAGDTTGWYIWAGPELSNDPEFFEPMHVRHLSERCPEIVKFLGLPPGWRFLKAREYEDVWYDPSLLNV